MRMIWEAVKLFRVPFTHPYIQSLTEYDLLLINESMNLDNPEYYRKMTNTFFDEDYDEYEKEVEEDDLSEEERRMMEEIISNSNKEKPGKTEGEIPVEEGDDFDEITQYSPIEEDYIEEEWEEV